MNEDIEQVLGEKLNAVFQRLLNGARGDIHRYSQVIAKDIIEATRHSDPETRDEILRQLKGQIVLVGELNRIRVNQEMQDLVDSVVDLAFDLALRAIGMPNPDGGQGDG